VERRRCSSPHGSGPALTGYTDSVNAVAFSPDGHTLASGSDDHTIRLWTLPSAIITGHTSTVYAVAFSPDGHTLASGSSDQTIRLWNITNPRPIPRHWGRP
jgi:WD40 repeat protein